MDEDMNMKDDEQIDKNNRHQECERETRESNFTSMNDVMTKTENDTQTCNHEVGEQAAAKKPNIISTAIITKQVKKKFRKVTRRLKTS